MYTLDNWIVTTKRIIDSVQNGFFHRSVAELQLDKIQDVSYKVEGLIPTFFNYGTVEIQTASKGNKFLFEQVSDPQRVKDIIMELIIESEKDSDSDHDKNSSNHVLVEDNGVPTPLTIHEADEDKKIIVDNKDTENIEKIEKNDVLDSNHPKEDNEDTESNINQ